MNLFAKIGQNCKILSDVTIGIDGKKNSTGAPIIGNNVYIGTGVKILGNISIADNVVIGANTVVTKSIIESNITVVGFQQKN